MQTRRDFVTQTSVFSVVFALSPTIAVARPARRTRNFMALPELHFEHFSAQVRTPFRLILEKGPDLALTLAETKQRRTPRSADGTELNYECFSLLFTGPVKRPLAQGLYTLEHPRIGRFELFLVPVIPKEPTQFYYEAVFNRSKSNPA